MGQHETSNTAARTVSHKALFHFVTRQYRALLLNRATVGGSGVGIHYLHAIIVRPLITCSREDGASFLPGRFAMDNDQSLFSTLLSNVAIFSAYSTYLNARLFKHFFYVFQQPLGPSVRNPSIKRGVGRQR